MSLNFQKAEYEGFPMRYITFLWDNYFRRYLAKAFELLFTVRILNCPTVCLSPLGNHSKSYYGNNFRTNCQSLLQMKYLANRLELGIKYFSVRTILVLKVKNVLILTVIYYVNHQLVIGDLVLKVKQVLLLIVLKARFDCSLI